MIKIFIFQYLIIHKHSLTNKRRERKRKRHEGVAAITHPVTPAFTYFCRWRCLVSIVIKRKVNVNHIFFNFFNFFNPLALELTHPSFERLFNFIFLRKVGNKTTRLRIVAQITNNLNK
jgi:hypothetical protein